MGLPVDLIVFGVDACFTLLFYKLYRKYNSTADEVKHAKKIELTGNLIDALDDLPGQNIAYAYVEGVIEPLGKALRSHHGEEHGVIHHLTYTEHRTKRTQGYWHDFTKTLRDTTETVPFKLINYDTKGAVYVAEPLQADYLPYTTTYDKFEPMQSGFLERGIDRLFGDVSKGFQETEQMVKVGATLLGFGKIALEDGKPTLKPSDGKPYILTNMKKAEVVKSLQSNSTVFKVLTIIFGITGTVILGVIIRERYRRWREERAIRRDTDAIRDATLRRRQEQLRNGHNEQDIDDQTACVVCLTNQRDVVLLECGHICLCADCVDQLPHPRKCPVCRETVSRIVPTFVP